MSWSGRAIPSVSTPRTDKVFIDGALAYDRANPPPVLRSRAGTRRFAGAAVKALPITSACGSPRRCCRAPLSAETVAITGAKAWTLTADAPIENATIVI